MMKSAILITVLSLCFSIPLFAEEEKLKADKGGSDPIADILLAPFAVIGAIVSGGYEYDPDNPRYSDWGADPWYGYRGRYGWNDPFYDDYYYSEYNYYRYKRHRYNRHYYGRHRYDPFRRYYFYNPCD